MPSITYNPDSRRFSTAIGKVADTAADVAGAVGNAVETGAEKVSASVKKTKRSFGELLKDVLISPKTKEDRLRRRTALSAIGTAISLGLAAKNHVDKNNFRADDTDNRRFNNEMLDYMKGRRKTLPKKVVKHTGIDATIDFWKEQYEKGKAKVGDWFASDPGEEDEDMASLSEEYREASREETGRMKKALNDMADRCRAKSVGF